MMKQKIAFIGHGYHEITRSHSFVLEYVKEFFDVDEYYDHNWSGGKKLDLTKLISGNYASFIFWQIIPDATFLKKIDPKKVVFFPMFDACDITHLIKHFPQYRHIKVICLSLAIHKKMLHYGFQSHYIKFFPKPQELFYGKEDEIFFWQRLSKININVVAKILQNSRCKIHLHKAVDPLQKFVQPSHKQEQQFQITYSDWLESKESLHHLMKDKAIYIAPRFREGVGMSYLEAMAMGKVVIANNNSTMNEYITHGETGFLQNFRRAKPIRFSNIKTIQNNIHQYMIEGHKKWQLEKETIITIIENINTLSSLQNSDFSAQKINRALFLLRHKLEKITINMVCWLVFSKRLKNKIRRRKAE